MTKKSSAAFAKDAKRFMTDTHLAGVHKAPRPRGRPSLTQGRAQTVQTSLSPSQAAWVASRGVPVAAYLRGLVEEAMDEAIQTKGYRPLSSDLDPSVIVKIGGDV